MKKRLTALLTAILCMTGAFSVIPANAADVSAKDDYIISTETFHYTFLPYFGLKLESEVCDPDFLVIGVMYSDTNMSQIRQYIVSPVQNHVFSGDGMGYLYASTVQRELGDIELQVGDLLKFEGGYEAVEIVPPIYQPFGDNAPDGLETEVIYLGHGVDLLGEEFADAIRMQVTFDQAELLKTKRYDGTTWGDIKINWGDIKINWGDVNMDDQLDILDCITVNKSLLGTSTTSYCIKTLGDVDLDGKLDSTDSLAILKEVVGLTVNYEPAVD